MKIEFPDMDDPNLAFQDARTQELMKVLVHRTEKKELTAQELLEEV